jgi:excisionase family DNA binding protein
MSADIEIRTGTAARILGISQSTVIRLAQQGQLAARRLPPRGWWRIKLSSVLKLINNSK